MSGNKKSDIHQGKMILSQGGAAKEPASLAPVHVAEVAERVYKLMQRDLMLERDRRGKLGG